MRLVKKSGLLVTFKTGFDHEKWLNHAVCEGFCPLAHFYFLVKKKNDKINIYVKKVKNIYKCEKKVGF